MAIIREIGGLAGLSLMREAPQDPVTFSRLLLGQNPWRLQREILTSAARNRLTAVKSCHAAGKTRNSALLALWALCRWKESLVITTAPTFRQVKVMWGEIAEARRNSRIAFPEPTATELKLADKRYAVGLSTNDPNKFQSYHASHVLIIADEAQGILNAIWEAVEGIRAGGDVRVLMQGNPTVTGGHYQDAFGRNRAIWKTFTISAFDTPNLQGLTIEQLLHLGLPVAEIYHGRRRRDEVRPSHPEAGRTDASADPQPPEAG
jgi:phage terminase large subunit